MTVDFLPFANDASSANVVTQAEYLAAASGSSYVQNGFSSGTARSNQINKAIRQSSVMVAAIAQFIAAETGQDVRDSGGAASVTSLTSQLLQALQLACLPNNSALHWDATNSRLGIGGVAPVSKFHVWASTANSGGETATHGVSIGTGASNQTLFMGYDGTADVAYINAAKTGIIRPVVLQSRGGNVGVGTVTPGQPLSVNGVIESITGGVKYPDGRTQTESAQFPSGTTMLFLQSSAPTGWTKSTTHDNKMLRIVSSSGGGSGGSAALSTAWSSVALSGTVAGHTLSVTELPTHTHSGTTGTESATHTHDYWRPSNAPVNSGTGSAVMTQYETQTSTESATHTHSFTTDGGTGGGASHTHGLTINSFTVTPAYVDAIICVKN
jgi:hypothetical protein